MTVDKVDEYPESWPHAEEGTQLWYLQNLLWQKGCKWGANDDWQCPAHEDTTASLGVGQGEKGAVIHCSAGCAPGDVIEALGVTWPLVFQWEPGEPGSYSAPTGTGEGTGGKRRSIEELAAEHGGVKARTSYPYRDAEGNLARVVVRYDFEDGTKTIRQKIHDPKPVLYKYARVLKAIERGLPIYVVEGEKSADALNAIARTKDGKVAAVATTSPGGAGRWTPEHGDLLRGADTVKVIADNDPAGFAHARDVFESLDTGGNLSVLRSMTDGKGDDLVDHLAAGFKVKDLRPVALSTVVDGSDGPDEDSDSLVGLVLPEVITDGAPKKSEVPWPSPNQPLDVAKKLAAAITWDGHGRIRRWREKWLYWTPEAGHYEHRDREDFHGEISDILWSVRTTNAQGELVPWNPNTRRVNDVLNMLAGVRAVKVPPSTTAGTRLSDGAKVSMLALRNGVLDIGEESLALSGGRLELIPHSPDYLIFHTQPFSYDPAASCPRWLEFLSETWPDDLESIQLLREWFGYVLSEDLWGEKFLALYGAPGSGKTTIDNTLRALLGAEAVTDTSLFQLGQKFGKTGLDTRKLAVAGDSRWAGGHKENEATVQTLLAITGRTSIEVEPKGKDKYSATPTARLMLIANERPNLTDPAGAIMRRLMLLETRHTVPSERRDTRLVEKLRAELPGILNWALEGLTELRERGSFTVPKSTLEEIDEIARDQAPIAQFVEDLCVLDVTATVPVREFNDAYREWRVEAGIVWPITDAKISGELKSRFPHLPPSKPVRVGETVARHRVGIRLGKSNIKVGM